MESKYRRLYLYASNSKAITKKPNQTIDDYQLKKQKSIEHLKQLLDIKIGLPPVTSIYAADDKAIQNYRQSFSLETRQPRILKTKSKMDRILHNQTFILPSNNLLKPLSTPIIHDSSIKKRTPRKLREEQKQKIYEKYINQYMQKIERENLLEKFPEKDYSKLVQDACEQIRKRMNLEHMQIQQVQINLQESRQDNKNKSPRPHKKSLKIFETVKIKRNDGQHEQSAHLSSFMAHIADKILLKRNEHRKSKSVADNNILKMNLQLVERKNALKNKVRKRTERQFVRNLTRHSFLQPMQIQQQNP